MQEKSRGGEKERGRGLETMLERPAGTRDEAADKGREAEPDKAAVLEKTRGPHGIEMEM